MQSITQHNFINDDNTSGRPFKVFEWTQADANAYNEFVANGLVVEHHDNALTKPGWFWQANEFMCEGCNGMHRFAVDGPFETEVDALADAHEKGSNASTSH